jgi:hypothetical protein
MNEKLIKAAEEYARVVLHEALKLGDARAPYVFVIPHIRAMISEVITNYAKAAFMAGAEEVIRVIERGTGASRI